jgi:hypothetical protein
LTISIQLARSKRARAKAGGESDVVEAAEVRTLPVDLRPHRVERGYGEIHGSVGQRGVQCDQLYDRVRNEQLERSFQASRQSGQDLAATLDSRLVKWDVCLRQENQTEQLYKQAHR